MRPSRKRENDDSLLMAMAFAIASGVKPEQGIYTAIIAGLFVSIFGGTRLQIAGPTGAFIVILAAIVMGAPARLPESSMRGERARERKAR